MPDAPAVSISMKDRKNIFPGAAPRGEAKPVYRTGSDCQMVPRTGEEQY